MTENQQVTVLDPSLNSVSETSVSLSISEYTKALIKAWQLGVPKAITAKTKISVSQTVSFLAFLYEKMRNAVEFREDHLIRRASIERIIKRRLLLNDNGRDISESLIKELLWARYYENNTLGEEKIGDIQAIIDKYFFLRNELAKGRSSKDMEKISTFMIEVLSCEIEENLSPDPRHEAITNYVYQMLRLYIAPFKENAEEERDVQVYIAIQKTFVHNDNPLIRFHLLKLMLPEITQIRWQNSDEILTKLYEVYKKIEADLMHPLTVKTRNIIKKQIAPFLILRDIFEQNNGNIEAILTDENKLKAKVDESCRKRYDESRDKLRRTAVRSFIYILLTKVIFALLLEIPYDLYIQKSISYIPMAINIIFPPILMAVIILTVSIPGDDNTKRIFQLIKGILADNPVLSQTLGSVVITKKYKQKGFAFTAIFSLIYLFTYLLSFGSIISILTLLKFNPISQGIFIFFITLVTFFAYRVISITHEFLAVDREGPFTGISDFFFLPIIHVGHWLSGEILTKFNFLIFFFDFIIEMPFKAIVEVFDEWMRFVKIKKDEIV